MTNILIWIDLEMTGLNPDSDRILEIASVVTSKDLDVIDKGISIAINQPGYLINRMDAWNTAQHKKSGLIDRVKYSTYSEKEAEEEVMRYIKRYTKPGLSPICGNTVHQDRFFLKKYMPSLESFFHYRNLDVSTIKILSQIWKTNIKKEMMKQNRHLALDDIYDSIHELKYYKKHIFNL